MIHNRFPSFEADYSSVGRFTNLIAR